MLINVMPDKILPGAVRVEAITATKADDQVMLQSGVKSMEPLCYVSLFIGPNAHDRASAYARWLSQGSPPSPSTEALAKSQQ